MNKESFKARRKKLVEIIKARNSKVGAILLIADFEINEKHVFRQESSFYYYTGITEPAVVLLIEFDEAQKIKETLFVPHYADNRGQWVNACINADDKSAKECAVDNVVYWGQQTKGYTFPLLFERQSCIELCQKLESIIKQKINIFTLKSHIARAYIQQKIVLERFGKFFASLSYDLVQDISDIVASMRRSKTKSEIEQIYKAIELTIIAQEASAASISEGKRETEVQAGIEYIFKEEGASTAFPSIVAAGKNSTILHYSPTNNVMRKNDLVIIDIGAQVNYYNADLTRTFPVSGTFTKRQREIYQLVLDTQDYIASLASPGYWLNNAKQPEKSLHHLAIKFLQERGGYDKYFVHGIGHFLGLDVHDVGDYNEPLQEGDVITIEPGLYLPQEGFGVRIEDNYWIIKDGAMCLSENLPKDVDTIEEMAQAELGVAEDVDEEEEDYND